MDAFPLSPQQRHIRSWSRVGATHDAGCEIRIDGELDVARLRAALADAVRRHGILRTRFVQPTPTADPEQVVADDGTYSFEMLEPGTLSSWDRYGTCAPEDGPALRATLVRPGSSRYLLVLTLPALCADARSLRNLADEIARSYDGGGDESGVTQYLQFGAWQNALAEDDDGPGPNRAVRAQPLPFEAAPGRRAGPGRAAHSVELAPDVLAGLDAAAARCRATPGELLLACWHALLWQQTRGDVVTGWVTDGRVYEELEPLVGPCAKALPVATRLAETDRFDEVVSRVRRALAEARDGQEFVTWSGDGPSSAVHPVWGFEFVDLAPAVVAGGAVFTLRDHVAWSGPFVVKLQCQRSAERTLVTLDYDRGRVDDEMARCLLDELVALAADAAANPTTPVGSLNPVSSAQARRLVVEFNRTATAFAADRCAHHLFERHAARSPDRFAVSFDGHSASYGELNARANRLARHLRELGAGTEVPVGVCLDRSVDMVVAMLAVHKAGAAYVPVDPSYPAGRVRAIVEDTGLPILVTQQYADANLPVDDRRTVWLDHDRAAIAAHGGTDLNLDIDPAQLAYVRHTSGSTGRPKGVQVPHRALANFLYSMGRVPGIAPYDSLVAVTTLSFDIAELELYLPLTVGARVTIASGRTAADPSALARLLVDASATVLQATPVTWRMLVTSGWAGKPDLTALVGGEALPPELAAQVRPRVRRLWNMYGPTETTIWSTCAEVGAGEEPVTVGRPIANTCVHVLDGTMRPVAVGMVGEVFIGGVGVARGYADRPDLTAERFVPDPFGCWPDGRMYRTGDLARYHPDGRLYVLGRADSQVKIRGFRIELGEVETVLARHPAVQAAVARTRREPSGEQRLDAYALAVPGTPPTIGELRDFLRDRLPPAMVPARIAVVASLPLTNNGKIDRAALPEITEGAATPAEHVPAGTRLEHVIAGVWQRALGVERVGMTDNFFELGGHSVLLVQVSNLLREELGREVTPLTMLEHPTIASLAHHLEQADGVRAAAPHEDQPHEDQPHEDQPHEDQPQEDQGVPATGRDRLRQRRSRVEER